MDKEKTVQIDKGDGSALRFVDEKGASHSYRHLPRTIYLKANSLSVGEGFSRLLSCEESPPTPRRGIQGFGSLCDESISVIGDQDNKAARIALSILGRTSEEIAEAAKNLQQNMFLDYEIPPDCDAFLGFTAAGWEIGNKDEWWLELSVAEKTLESLVNAILNKQARSLYNRSGAAKCLH